MPRSIFPHYTGSLQFQCVTKCMIKRRWRRRLNKLDLSCEFMRRIWSALSLPPRRIRPCSIGRKCPWKYRRWLLAPASLYWQTSAKFLTAWFWWVENFNRRCISISHAIADRRFPLTREHHSMTVRSRSISFSLLSSSIASNRLTRSNVIALHSRVPDRCTRKKEC